MADWQRRFPPRNPWPTAVDQLKDVDAPGPADGDTLIYDAASGQWKTGPGGSGDALESVVAGSHITVDNTDPKNPVVNVSGISTAGYAEGTSNPVSPALNDKFYRTDLNLLIYYDGTRWLTVHEYSLGIGGQIDSANFAVYLPVRQGIQLYLTRFTCVTFVNGTSNGSNYWTVALSWRAEGNADTPLLNFATSADTGVNWISHDQDINSALPTTARALRIGGTRNGSPGQLYWPTHIFYRLIVT